MLANNSAKKTSLAVPPGFDPQAVPIQAHCAHEPLIANGMLLADSLRQRFATPPLWTPEITDENRYVMAANIIAQRQDQGLSTQAAVLIPLVLRNAGISVLLTQRTDHLHDHAGQISFPGGRMEPTDNGPAVTALRESFEEIGLAASQVELIGQLPEYLTVSGYRVIPMVGLVQAQGNYVLDAFEVAAAFEVPLEFLMNPANHQVRVASSEQGSRRFYAMPFENRFIWGATAGMLRNLYHLLKV